jgi:hypothetical protein
VQKHENVVTTCGYPHWRCVLQRCLVCPDYEVPFFEREVDKFAITIKFHSYCKGTKCSNHCDLVLNASQCDACNLLPGTAKKGRVRTRKYLTLLTRPVGIFMQEFYIPLLRKYSPSFGLRSDPLENGCDRMRFDWFRNEDPLSVKTI